LPTANTPAFYEHLQITDEKSSTAFGPGNLNYCELIKDNYDSVVRSGDFLLN
jgi:hypothetical protein